MQRTILALILSTTLIAVGFFVDDTETTQAVERETEVLSASQSRDDSNGRGKDKDRGSTTTTRPPRDTTTTSIAATTTTTPGSTTTTSGTVPTEPPTGDCVLSGHHDGITVAAGQTCEVDGLVTSSQNVIVEGTLVMRAGDTLRFVDVDNTAFKGGGDVPLPSDVGLWVVGGGVLDARGTAKEAWGYGWQGGWSGADDIVAAPHTEGDFTGFKDVNSSSDVPGKNEYGFSTEVLNLTRDVKIEGTPGGYAHVFIKSTGRSTLEYVELRYLGVQVGGNDASGRYGLHLHKNGSATSGMTVRGVVARNIGNHAFVPHASHGITFEKTIAYDVVEEAYWWDPAPQDLPNGAADPNATNDLTIFCAIAAKVDTDGEGQGGGFYMGSSGNNVSVTDSVAVGVYSSGGKSFDISGFRWPGTGRTNWEFHDNVSHNNAGHGMFVWQNTSERHLVQGFDSYFNAKFGIVHGAYRNAYGYSDVGLWGNGKGAIEHHANARADASGTTTQTWDAIRGDGTWLVVGHGQDPLTPIQVSDVVLPMFQVQEGDGHGSWFNFDNAQFGTVDLSGAHPSTVIEGLAQ